MSGSLDRLQIRDYKAQPSSVVMGLTTQTINIEFTTVQATKMVSFGNFSNTATPANDPLLPDYMLNIRMIINKDQVIIDGMDSEEFVEVVQNPELREANIIAGNGNHLYKVFNPALPVNTRVQIQIEVQTLALAYTTPPVSATQKWSASSYDSDYAAGKWLRYYIPIPITPQPAGVTAGAQVTRDLGNFARTERFMILRTKVAAGEVDSWLEEIDILSDGQRVIRLNAAEMKQHYNIITDGLLPNTGYYGIKFPGAGFQAAAQQQISIAALPYNTLGGGFFDGWEVYEKVYV